MRDYKPQRHKAIKENPNLPLFDVYAQAITERLRSRRVGLLVGVV